jgi:predicted Zn-dependent protease
MNKTFHFEDDPCAWFSELRSSAFKSGKPNEVIVLSLDADLCDFARVSRSKLVQGSRVEQITCHVATGFGPRRMGVSLSLPASLKEAKLKVLAELQQVRGWLDCIPDDPFFVDWSQASESIETCEITPLSVADFFDDFQAISLDLDVVGLYANGPRYSGWATSLGHFHWAASQRYFFDFSIYARKDKAVKDFVSGTVWSRRDYEDKVNRARPSLELLFQAPRQVSKGKVRALLCADAVSDLLQLSSWGGYSARSHLTGDSPFEALQKGRQNLSTLVTLYDDLSRFGSPRVQDQGFLRPERFDLIQEGRWVDWYCSPRTAKEYGLQHNFSGSGEGPSGLVMQAGNMPAKQACEALDTGLYISNVWYLNYSDRHRAGVTGMTRFASMWVENGKMVGPIEPLRFNDSLLELFGPKLVALGDMQELFESTSTYGPRARGGVACPSALVRDLEIVL